MEPNETMVEQQETEPAAEEEILQEDLVEEPDESESLESALQEDSGEQQPAAEEEKPETRSEPGWIKGRVDKAVQRAIAETEARMQAQFDKQMAPYREHMMSLEAQELVRSGKVKDLETAKELVRYRQGQPQPQTQEQPVTEHSNSQSETDPATQARIDMLRHQANRIKEQRGIDVISEFQNNEETKQKIVSGEWDFYDVADALGQTQQKKKVPAPMRSPNGASAVEKSTIASMTDEQFEKLDKKIKGGARYSIR